MSQTHDFVFVNHYKNQLKTYYTLKNNIECFLVFQGKKEQVYGGYGN